MDGMRAMVQLHTALGQCVFPAILFLSLLLFYMTIENHNLESSD